MVGFLTMCGIFPHHVSNSLTPMGCPTIQSNFDTNYLDLPQIPQVKGSVPPLQTAAKGVTRLLILLLGWLQILGFPWFPILGSVIH